jgi:folate-binding protein YgfZ
MLPAAPPDYAALRDGAVWFDRSTRTRTRFSGPKAAEVLTGLVTNDVTALHPGQGQYAAALTPKGKIVADLRIFLFDRSLLVDVVPAAAVGWGALVRKYVNPRLAKYSDETATLADVGVFGPHAAELLAGALGADPAALHALEPYHHVSLADATTIARALDLGVEVPGFDVFVEAESRDRLIGRLSARSAVAGSSATWTAVRIEAGRPEWGIDMDESTLPQEANLDKLDAISHTKGCYTGQEIVARIHFRGHVNRHLRGLLFRTPFLPPARTPLVAEGGALVGDVRSTAISPRFGPIGLAMVRRDMALGALVTAGAGDGSTETAAIATAAIAPLPFVHRISDAAG